MAKAKAKKAREARLRDLDRAERAINASFSTGKADRSKITRMAQLDAAEAVARAGEAMEADEVADEAMRIAVIAEKSGNRDRIRVARRRARDARRQANREHRAATRSAKDAYDAIKFSAPNKMGFMRAVQVGFAAHIVFELVLLVMTSRDVFAYNVGSILDWVMVILEGMAFWMFANRYKIARPFTIAMAAVGLVVPAIVDLVAHSFRLSLFLVNGAFYIFIIFYFIFSKRVKATLVNDLSMLTEWYGDDDFVIERRGWPFVRNLGIYFVVFSILGHWMEMAMCQLIIAGLVEGEYDPTNTMLWRDWLYPFPMEGMAVVLIALILYPLYTWLKHKYNNLVVPHLLSFLANALTCTLIEFSMGLVCNSEHQLWDYSENFGNIMGQVCLQNTMAFGVACSVIAWLVYPMLERSIARLPRDVMNIVFAAVMVFGGIVFSLYIIEPPSSVVQVSKDVTIVAPTETVNQDLLLVQNASEAMEKHIAESDSLSKEQRERLEKNVKEIERLIDDSEKVLDSAA